MQICATLSLVAFMMLMGNAASAQSQIPSSRWPGMDRGVPQGNYNITVRTKADMALPDPYDRNEAWAKMPVGRAMGSTSAISIDRDGKSVWVADRCGGNGCIGKPNVNPIMEFDEHGNLVRQFGKGLFVYPHGIWVDQEDNVWVADTQSNVEPPPQGPGMRHRPAGAPAFRPRLAPPGSKPLGDDVLKFSPTGKLLMVLGTPGRYGYDAHHFNQPSAVITAPNGDIFVADGHELTNTDAPPRIVKFNKYGKFLMAWDICTAGPQTSDCSHSLAMDTQGRLFVADRGNSRVDIFSEDGKRLAEWKQFGRPSGVYVDKHDILYVADSESSVVQGNGFLRGIHIGSARTGKVTAFIPSVWGNPRPWQPLFLSTGPEGVVADAEGHIFSAQTEPRGEVVRYQLRPSWEPDGVTFPRALQ